MKTVPWTSHSVAGHSKDTEGLMRLVSEYGSMNKLLQGYGVQLHSTLAAPQLFSNIPWSDLFIQPECWECAGLLAAMRAYWKEQMLRMV